MSFFAPEQEDKLKEECGVFGIYNPDGSAAAPSIYYGLSALQHRGQEACGIAVCNTNGPKGNITWHKDMGLVSEVFHEESLDSLKGNIGIGHVRYSTTGASTVENAQPLVLNYLKGTLALAHNGNITNASELRQSLQEGGAIFRSTTDSEVIACDIARERTRTSCVEDAILQTARKLKGGYALVIISPRKLIGVRDPLGLKPLCLGKRGDSYILASESCALTSVGAELIRDLLPGEILVFSEEGVESRREHCGTQKQKTCIFEYIYFARPDSVIDKISVSAARIQAGKLLAQTKPVKADIVIGVPDSGLDAALGFSEVSGIPYGIGLVKNKYIGRTFISPGQKERIDLVRMKLSPIPSVIQGKRVVLIDDSIVRGTTSRQLVSLLREAGAKEIHLRISAPPFLHPCYYGTDIDSEENLIASHHGEKEVATLIGADSLGYLPLECLHELTGTHSYCDACFSGKYATEIPTDVRKDRFEQKLSER